MSKHTPGPWVVDMDETGAGDICPKNDLCISICAVQRADYSAETDRYFDGQTTEANRRLIAAAPELLEMLQRMVTAAYSIGGEHVTGHDLLLIAADHASEIIAKATA